VMFFAVASTILGLAAVVYLIYALVRPERF
jgi:K+-transporting ATPase KdpF subunit